MFMTQQLYVCTLPQNAHETKADWRELRCRQVCSSLGTLLRLRRRQASLSAESEALAWRSRANCWLLGTLKASTS